MERPAHIDPETAAPGSVFLSAVAGASLAVGGFAIGVGATGIAVGSPWFWFINRASGLVAYLLLWGSVTWGLLLSTGMGRQMLRPPLLLDVHQFLGAAGIGFAAVHGLILLGDRTVNFPLLAILLPFWGEHEPWLVALGQGAFWLSLLLVGSFQLRQRIGGPAWRRLHYVSFPAFGSATLHGLVLGTDGTTPGVMLLYLATLAPVLFLSFYRALSLKEPVRSGAYSGSQA